MRDIILKVTVFILMVFPSSVFAEEHIDISSLKRVEQQENATAEQVMFYDLYAGGINAVKAELNVSYLKDDRYHILLSAWTRGFLGKLIPWKGSFETKGWLLKKDGKHFEQPDIHESITTWKNETETKTYAYQKDGGFKGLTITEARENKAPLDKSPKDLPDELVQGSLDALTATLHVMNEVGLEKPCEGSGEVFDGKRRFRMNFKHEADVVLKKSRYNMFEGNAVRCTIEVEPLEGKWHEKPRGWMSIQEQGREKGALPTLWLGRMKDGAPAIPVKLRVKTDYGTLFMHLTEYVSGDQNISLEDN